MYQTIKQFEEAWKNSSDATRKLIASARAEGPGLETSFANGGQISACHAYPWAAPGVPAKLLKWLGRKDAPLLFHLRADRSGP